MAQRFNAPPGWNVPPDFVPTSDWQPDPSWPPAPAGWNYWVEETPGFGTASSPSYGTPPVEDQPTTYGAQPTGAYGTPTSPAQGAGDPSPYGAAPAGAFGSTAPGSANAMVASAQAAAAKKSLLIGAAITVIAVVVWVISYQAAEPGSRYFAPWYFVLAGIVMMIRGGIEHSKAKKAEAAQLGYGGQSGMPPGVTPPGSTPPGQNPPGF